MTSGPTLGTQKVEKNSLAEINAFSDNTVLCNHENEALFLFDLSVSIA